MVPGAVDKPPHAHVELALLWRRNDRDAPTAPDLEQPLVPKLPERAEDGVSVHLQHGGQVERRREPLARAGLSIRDRTANLRRNLLVQVCRLVSVQLPSLGSYAGRARSRTRGQPQLSLTLLAGSAGVVTRSRGS